MDYKTLISSLPKLDNVLSPVAKNTSLSNAAVALRNKLMNSAYGGAQKVLDAGANVSEYISKNTNPAFIRSMKKTADWRQKFLPWGLGAAGVGAGAYGLSKLLEEKPWYMKALDSLQQGGTALQKNPLTRHFVESLDELALRGPQIARNLGLSSPTVQQASPYLGYTDMGPLDGLQLPMQDPYGDGTFAAPIADYINPIPVAQDKEIPVEGYNTLEQNPSGVDLGHMKDLPNANSNFYNDTSSEVNRFMPQNMRFN